MDETLLQIQNLYKSFGSRPVLRDLSLTLRAGQITGLLAKNGAGKSTLISLISGLLKGDSGEIIFSGQEGQRGTKLPRKFIGVAPQETGVYPGLTLKENLEFAGRLYGLRGKLLNLRIEKTVELFGLADYLKEPARNLSGGWKRRLHTAMAVLHEPRLILLDEPTVGSDPLARKFILDGVKSLAARGAAILYTGHYFPELEDLNANIAVLHEGRIVAEDSLDALLFKHGTPGLRVHFSTGLSMNSKTLESLLPLAEADSWSFRNNVLTLFTQSPEIYFQDLANLSRTADSLIRKWEFLRADLESVYFSLTEPNLSPQTPLREDTLELSSNIHQ